MISFHDRAIRYQRFTDIKDQCVGQLELEAACILDALIDRLTHSRNTLAGGAVLAPNNEQRNAADGLLDCALQSLCDDLPTPPRQLLAMQDTTELDEDILEDGIRREYRSNVISSGQ